MSKGIKMISQVNGLFPGELQPDATVAGCIDVYENAWPNPLETIKMIENETLNPDSGISCTRATTIGQGINQNVPSLGSPVGRTRLAVSSERSISTR